MRGFQKLQEQCKRESSELDMPRQETVQYAAYILNHYSRSSHADHLCLARDLERHGWSKLKRHNDPDQ